MANYFDSEAYKVFKEELLAQTLPNQTEDPDNPNVLTYGDIFSSDGIEANTFAQQHFLNNLRLGGKDLENLTEETNVDAGVLRRSAERQLDKSSLQKLNDYVLSYSVQTTTPDLPKQRSQVPEYNLLPPTPMASMAGGAYPVLPPKAVMGEVDRRDRELTEEEMIVLRRGGDITSDYYTIQDLSPYERYFGDKGFHAVPSKDSPSLMKSLVSLTYPTKEEAYELVKDEDPDAVFSYIDPRDITRGLLVRSPKTGNKLVPWRPNIGAGLFPSTDTTFRSELENIYGPALDGFIETTLRDLMPELVGGGVGLGLGGILRKGAKKIDDTLAKKGPEGLLESLKAETFGTKLGKGTAKLTGIFGTTAVGVGLVRYLMLMHAKNEGIHPNLDSLRAFQDAGLIGAMAGAGAVGGDLILRVAQNITNRLTGKNIPEEMVRRIRVQVERLRKESELPDEELSLAEVDKILQPYARNAGRKFSETKTLGELTDDEILQNIEAEILDVIPQSDPARIAINQMLLERSSTLQNFYEAMVINSGKNKGEMPSYEEFKAHFAKIAREQKEAALAAEREGIEALGPSQVLAGDEPVSEVADVIGEQVSTSSLFPDSRSKFFIMRDEQFQDANEALQNVLESDEALGMSTTALDKYIGSTIQKFMRGSGNTAPIRDLEGAEAAETIRDLIPMSDGRSILRTLMGVRERDELGRFIAKPEFTLADLVNARINLGSLERSPNKTIRDYAIELKSGFDSAIDDLIRANRAEGLRGDLTSALQQIDEVRRNAIDGKVLREIVSVENYPEMARKILSTSPREVNKLFNMLDELDLQDESIGFRAEEVRAAVLQQLRREIQDPELTTAQQNKKFRQILRDRGEQLQQIFPEEKVADFKSFANFSKAAEADINASSKRIRRLLNELKENVGENPLQIISKFLSADKLRLEETGAREQLKKLSQLADEYPELRRSMQGVFSDYMEKAFRGLRYSEKRDAGTVIIDPKAFNISPLENILLGYGSDATLTKGLSNDLSLMLGKEMGKDYAKLLQILAKEVGLARNRRSAVGYINKGGTDIGEESVKDARTASKFFIPPLTQFGRRVTTLFGLLGAESQRYMLEVLADPTKTKQLIKLANRQMTQREFARAIALIYFNPSADIGGERKDDAYDRLINRITTTDDEDRDKILGGISEGLSMRGGGGVYNALVQAEERNRMLRRGRS